MSQIKKKGAFAILALIAALQIPLPSIAQPNSVYLGDPYYSPYFSSPYAPPAYNPYYSNWINRQYFGPKKKVEDTAIGIGLGAAAGAAAGAISGHGALKGSIAGAGTGAGIGLIKSSATMYNHPIVKKAVYGTAIGAALGYATSGGQKSELGNIATSESKAADRKKIEKEAAIGGVLGLGLGLLTTNRNTPPPPPGYPYY